MQAVMLKGFKDGYEVIIDPAVSFEEVKPALKDLFLKLSASNQFDSKKTFAFNINTKSRLLDPDQKAELEAIVAEFKNFKIHRIEADVMYQKDALEMMESRNVHVSAQVIRNGQDVCLKGDILFLGAVHPGGILRATGTIYLMADIEGVVHAGYPDKSRAVVVGSLQHAQKVRIGDAVAIVDELSADQVQKPVAFVNDLHSLDFAELDKLKTLRPKLFARVGGI